MAYQPAPGKPYMEPTITVKSKRLLMVDMFTYPGRTLSSVVQINDEKENVREKSRVCHNHKPQPFPNTKRKKKQTEPNKRKSNTRTKSTKISFLP